MSAENILEKIRKEAARREDEILARAQETADCRRAETVEAARRDAGEIARKSERDCAAEREYARLSAELSARKNTLAKKRAILDAAFGAALQKLEALSGAEFAAFMGEQLSACGLAGETALVLNARDRARIDQKTLENWSARASEAAGAPCLFVLSDAVGTFRGGAVARGALFDVDLSFERMVGEMRAEAEPALARALFGQEG